MSKPKPPPRRETFWTKASYVAAQDITAVAIYRLASGVMGIMLLGLLSYFGNRLISGEEELRGDIAAIRVDMGSTRSIAIGAQSSEAELKGRVDMDHVRADRIIDRLNADENRVSKLEAQLDLYMRPMRLR